MAKISALSKTTSGSTMTNKIFDFIPDGVMIQDKLGNITYVNPKFCSLVGFPAEELVGLSHKEAAKLLLNLKTVKYEDIVKTFHEVLKGRSIASTSNLKSKQGSSFPYQQFINPINDDKGDIIGVFYIYKDLHHELLLEISHAINSSLNIETIIESTVDTVVKHLSLSSCAIFLYNDHTELLDLVACNIMTKNEMKLCKHKLGEGAPGIIAAERRPIYVKDMKTDPLIHFIAKAIHDNKSSIGFPLISKGELLGVMAFDAIIVRDFTPSELYLFENIANQLAMAIYNAKLYNITKKLSITDGLTGLYNHQYFQKRLEEELKRSKRNSNPLSLLMLDLDNFKAVNDHFGHPEGDKVLIQVAEILNHNIRANDIICRYGGEEFSVILTDCTKESAYHMSERIRSSVEKLNVGIKGIFKMTTSIGIAAYPDHADTRKDLIETADNALYKAKVSKNTICVAKNN